MTLLNPKSAAMRYHQVYQRLLEDVRATCQPGDTLPAGSVLATRFDMDRALVERALSELVEEGVLENVPGAGWRVLSTPIDYAIHKSTRFTETLSTMGEAASSQVVKKEVIPATSAVARRLGLSVDTPVVLIENLRKVNGRPFAVSGHFLLMEFANGVMSGYERGSLHYFLAERHELRLRRTHSLVTAVMPRARDVELLQVDPDQPVLRVTSVNVREPDGRPLEYVVTHFRSDAVRLQIDFS